MLSFDVVEDAFIALMFAVSTAWVGWLGSLVWRLFS